MFDPSNGVFCHPSFNCNKIKVDLYLSALGVFKEYQFVKNEDCNIRLNKTGISLFSEIHIDVVLTLRF